MDYSAVSSDSDALHGASPWGSSSPRANRSFPSPSDPPDSPGPIRGHSYSQSQDSVPESPYQPAAPSEASDSPALIADSHVSQQASYQSEAPQQSQSGPQDAQAQVAGQQQQQYQQRQGAARYHTAKQQRPVAQYKLQAKVTALERTGRKDPVIRFDVHVWLPFMDVF